MKREIVKGKAIKDEKYNMHDLHAMWDQTAGVTGPSE